jgi:hypothetical protein
MQEQYDRPINVRITKEMEDKLLRYCTIHGITKRDAVRMAITEMLSPRRTEPPKLDKDVPL